MSDRYIIEVSSQPAGIVVRCPGGFRFSRLPTRFNRLEGQLFRNAREAERAAIRFDQWRIDVPVDVLYCVSEVSPKPDRGLSRSR